MQNNEMLIYPMDLDEEDQENKDYLSTTSKSDQYKTTPPEFELLNAQTIDTLHSTQIIKIKPNPQSQCFDLNQNPPKTQSHSNLQTKQNIILKNNENRKDQSENDIQEDDSPVKLNKPRRKRMESPLKRRKHLQEQIMDYENAQTMQQQQNFTDKISQNSNEENDQDKTLNNQNKWNFQTIDNKKINQKEQKLHNYLQLEDSERHFKVKEEEMPKQQSKFSKREKVRNVNSSLQISDRQQVRQISSCQVLIDDLQADSQDYKDSSDEEQVYENDSVSEEEQQNMFVSKKLQKPSQGPIRIVKQLPKHVIIQTTLESLIMNPVHKNMKMVCRFCVQTKYFGMSKQYNLIVEQTGQTVLSAKKQHFSFTGSKFIISLNKDFISKRKENQFWTGRLQSNFSGNSYQLSQRKFSSSQNSTQKHSLQSPNDDAQDSQNSDKYEESLAAVINFENNLWGFSGIRKMEMLKLDSSKLTQRDIVKSVTLEDILQRNELSKMTKIQTTKPQYNKVTKRYSLSFDKKAKIPSSKNIILHWKVPVKEVVQKERNYQKLKNSFSNMDKMTLDQSTELRSLENKTTQKGQKFIPNKQVIKGDTIQCLLIGKQSEKQYLVEVGYPLSIFEAFGACLANEDTKYMVN